MSDTFSRARERDDRGRPPIAPVVLRSRLHRVTDAAPRPRWNPRAMLGIHPVSLSIDSTVLAFLWIGVIRVGP
jgi:hypothetical protein